MAREKKPPAPKVPVVYVTHAESICSDCGKKGCWIPVTHKPKGPEAPPAGDGSTGDPGQIPAVYDTESPEKC